MRLRCTFTDRTSCLVEHERGAYICPLADGIHRRLPCPIHCKPSKHGGCTAMMPTSVGARLRYQLDRQGEFYKSIYRQRTADERINSQALALGIERPHLRNGAAIANRNTLIYTSSTCASSGACAPAGAKAIDSPAGCLSPKSVIKLRLDYALLFF